MCVQWNELSKAMEVILTALIQTFLNSKCQKLLLIYYSKVGDKKTLRGAVKKNKNSIFKDIIQIDVVNCKAAYFQAQSSPSLAGLR